MRNDDDSLLAGSSSPGWRSELPQNKGMPREVKIVVYSFAFAALLGIIGGMVWWFFPHRIETKFIPLPVQYDVTTLLDLPTMPTGSTDAALLQKLFENADNIELNQYKVKKDIESYLGRQFDPATRNQDNTRLIIYLAGLGRQVNGQPYLLPADSQEDVSTWIPLQSILDTIQKHPAVHKMLLLDLACPTANVFRGPMKNDVSDAIDDLLEQMRKEGTLKMPVLTSCSRGEVSLPLWVERRSLFGYYLEQGLAQEAAVNGSVTVESLADYMNSRVDYWAHACLGATQRPKLYKPAKGYQNIELRKYLRTVASTVPTAPASTEPPAPENAAAKEEARKAKEKEIMTQVEAGYFPDALLKAWQERDTRLLSTDWLLAYPAIRQGERQLLTAERFFQATRNPDPINKLNGLPALPRMRLNVLYSLFQESPRIDEEWKKEKEWDKLYSAAKDFSPDPKKPEELTASAEIVNPQKALLISQLLWNKLVATGTLTAESLNAYSSVLQGIEQVAKKGGAAEERLHMKPVELHLLKAIAAKTYTDPKDFAVHADNIKKLLRLVAAWETEVAVLLQDAILLPAWERDMSDAHRLLYEAAQLYLTQSKYDGAEPVAEKLKSVEEKLTAASRYRQQQQKNRQTYWECIKVLHASADRVVDDAQLMKAWVAVAEAAGSLGTKLHAETNQAGASGTFAASAELDALTQPYLPDALKKRENAPPVLATLLSELQGSQLPAEVRKRALRDIMVNLMKQHEEVRKQDIKGKPPAQTPRSSLESEYAQNRTTMAKQLQALAGITETDKPAEVVSKYQDFIKQGAYFDAARMECFLPMGQLPDVEKLALGQASRQATLHLAEWLQTRLQTQQQLLNKIDSDFATLYTRPIEACKQLVVECQKLLK